MRLYLIRHAFAGQHGDPNYPDDSLRPLTGKGKKGFARLVKWLVRRKACAPQVIGTSPYVRCVQTADILAERLSSQPDVRQVAAFAPGASIQKLFTWLQEYPNADVAYVGHAPDIDEIAAALLGTNKPIVQFAKGGVMAFDIDVADDIADCQAQLRWYLSPKLLKK